MGTFQKERKINISITYIIGRKNETENDHVTFITGKDVHSLIIKKNGF